MREPYEFTENVHLLSSIVPVPGIGMLQANAYLVRGSQPYLVDTGLYLEADVFMETLSRLIDPAELRWIYLTHSDADHIGALHALLARAPEARVITNFLGMAKMGLLKPLPELQLHLMNAGSKLDLGDRTLTAIRPPLFDSPDTTAVYDDELDVLFSSDCFGGPFPQIYDVANDIPDDELRASQLAWAVIDSPWVQLVEKQALRRPLDRIAGLNPEWICSSHLPPAHRLARQLCDNLVDAAGAAPFAGPEQEAFEMMRRSMEAGAPA